MTVTIATSGFNILAHGAFVFTSANEVAHHISRKEAATLREQPGYSRGEQMTVRFTASGATRLYVKVGAQWMDASLQDLGAPAPSRAGDPAWVKTLNAA